MAGIASPLEKDLKRAFGIAKRTHKEFLNYQTEVTSGEAKRDAMDNEDETYKQVLDCLSESNQMVQDASMRLTPALDNLQEFLDTHPEMGEEALCEATAFMALPGMMDLLSQ